MGQPLRRMVPTDGPASLIALTPDAVMLPTEFDLRGQEGLPFAGLADVVVGNGTAVAGSDLSLA